jgi:hypothetical protein
MEHEERVWVQDGELAVCCWDTSMRWRGTNREKSASGGWRTTRRRTERESRAGRCSGLPKLGKVSGKMRPLTP